MSGVWLFKSLCNPHLDDGLPRNAEAPGFTIERLDHPDGEIHVGTLLLSARAIGLGEVQVLRDVFAIVELLVKLDTSFDLLRRRALDRDNPGLVTTDGEDR